MLVSLCSNMAAIGIHIGTSSCNVGICKDAGVEILQKFHLGCFSGHRADFSRMCMTMKHQAEARLNVEVHHAVVAVPDLFTDSDCDAVRAGCASCELHVIDILTESKSAVVAYGLEQAPGGKRTALIFNWSENGLYVSLVNVLDGVVEMKASKSGPCLGANAFDDVVVKRCTQQEQSLTQDLLAMQWLHEQCRLARETLALKCWAEIRVHYKDTESLEDIEYSSKLSRARYEELCNDQFEACLRIVGEHRRDIAHEPAPEPIRRSSASRPCHQRLLRCRNQVRPCASSLRCNHTKSVI